MIRSIDGISLSAEYRHNVAGEEPKLDFGPRRYDYLKEGYSLIHHDLFKNAKDSVFANYSRLDLTDKIGMSTITDTELVDQSDIVIYTMLKAHNGQYLRVVGNRIYADGKAREQDKTIEYDSSYMFKFERKWDEVRNEAFIEIMNGDLYFKFNPDNSTIELKDRDIGDPGDLFKWQVKLYNNGDKDKERILIYSYADQPWGSTFNYPFLGDGTPAENTTQEFGKSFKYESVEGKIENGVLTNDESGKKHYIPYRGLKRYWSVYDGYQSEVIYDGDFSTVAKKPLPNIVKVNGILWKNLRGNQPESHGSYPDGYAESVVPVRDTYKNASNNYIFLMDNGSYADPNSLLMGFDGKIRWVQFYNDFYDKFFNNTLEPKVIIDDVKPNFIVDVPYETQFDNEEKAISFIMSSGRQRIDLMQAKNVETPTYRYTYKDGEK